MPSLTRPRSRSGRFRTRAATALAALFAISLVPPAVAAFEYYELNVTFEQPRAAVTGSLYTVRPVYPDGYVVPSDALCAWRLRWGDDASLWESRYNETYGRVDFEVPAAEGGCTEWTFTLPYGPALQYQFEFSLCLPTSPGSYWCPFAMTDDSTEGVFQAAFGTTDRHIWKSNLPVAYLLPDTFIATVGKPVTYRLYGSEGYTPPTSSTTWSATCTCRLGPYPTQTGGATFTFTPDTVGNWKANWSVFGPEGTLNRNANFDPPARAPDTSAPTIGRTPYTRVKGGGQVTTTAIPFAMSWTGSDTGWGIDRYQVQQSRNAGTWSWLSLPAPTATSLSRSLAPNGSYRFRVRAIDKAGNVGAWKYTATLYPRRNSDSDQAIVYSSSWTTVSDTTALGGSLHRAGVAGSGTRYTFTGRSVAWIASMGPGMGSADIYLDGAYVRRVSLAATSPRAARVVFERSWASAATHTVQIRPVGNGPVTVDGFVRMG